MKKTNKNKSSQKNYLKGPNELFNDMNEIHTMKDYMKCIVADGMADDLINLVDVVRWHMDQIVFGGSTRWDTEGRDNEERLQLLVDIEKIKEIHREIQRELNSRYVMVCNHCGDTYFYDEYPNNNDIQNYCKKCRTNSYSILEFEDWLIKENKDLYDYLNDEIDPDKHPTVFMRYILMNCDFIKNKEYQGKFFKNYSYSKNNKSCRKDF